MSFSAICVSSLEKHPFRFFAHSLNWVIYLFIIELCVFFIYSRYYPIVWRRKWQPTPVLLPGKSHGWRSLVVYSPWGRKELDTTERHHFHFSLSCIEEGNGNPLQCSCLENPRDWGACWAAIYGVAQSRTQLKWLSSSSPLSVTCFANVFFHCLGGFFSFLKVSFEAHI